jgi:osmotically inducible protein OsmC
MAFANTLDAKGYRPDRIESKAICTLSPEEEGGFKITKMRLETRGQVSGIDE